MIITPHGARTKVDRAGRLLRDWWKAPNGSEDEDGFNDEVTVGQRLKRNPQILNKLGRFESMRLTQMEDIAGADSIETIRRTHAHYFDAVETASPFLATA